MSRKQAARLLQEYLDPGVCVFIGCKAGRALMRKYIKEAKRVEK